MKTEELQKGIAKLKTQVSAKKEKSSDTRNDPQLRSLKKMLKRKQRKVLKAKYAEDCAKGLTKKKDD